MANNVSNYLEMKGTEEVIAQMDDLFDKARDCKYDEQMSTFVKTFYDNPGLGEDGKSTINAWMYDNAGVKWMYVEDCIGEGEWNIQSANYTPKEFWIRLYKLASKIDPEVVIEVKYQDEGYSPVGGFVIKKSPTSVIRWFEKEVFDLEDPTVDMNYGSDGYEDASQDFYEKVDDTQIECVSTCHEMIDSNKGNW